MLKDPNDVLTRASNVLNSKLVSTSVCSGIDGVAYYSEYFDSELRVTVIFGGSKVEGVVEFQEVEQLHGARCFNAVFVIPEQLRGYKKAKQMLRSALAVFKEHLRSLGTEAFAIEVLVERENQAAFSVAKDVINPIHLTLTDPGTGKAMYSFQNIFQTKEGRYVG